MGKKGVAVIGFQIRKRERKVDAATVAKFRELPVANISDSMSRMTAGGAALRPMHRGGALAGPAFTVKTRPGDNLMVHKALDIAEPGDVIVVDGGGDLTNSLIGEMMVAHAEARGIGGIVIYGAIRDFDTLHAGNFPVFAAGITHRGPYKDGPGEINVAIAIEGMVIEPGDLIVGDGDGIVCVPFDATTEVLKAAEAKHQAEIKQLAAIKEGRSDRAWVDATLVRLGCATRT
jgi:RraA family protein